MSGRRDRADAGRAGGHPVRIEPLPRDAWTDEAVEAMNVLPDEMQPGPDETIHSLSVLAHHPDAAAAVLTLTLYLRFRSTLSDRERELLILRTVWLRGAEYELTRHARNALRYGFTREELQRIAVGSAAPEWDPAEALLLRAAEELCRDTHISDATWNALSERYSRQQLMDIAFTVGTYEMLAMAFNSFGLQPEPGFPPFPAPDSRD